MDEAKHILRSEGLKGLFKGLDDWSSYGNLKERKVGENSALNSKKYCYVWCI